MPSNDGRGYVLRRIMRRAIRYGRKLSTTKSFLAPMSEVLISHMGDFFPELIARKQHILSTIQEEEKGTEQHRGSKDRRVSHCRLPIAKRTQRDY